jgi:hypothetical protein
MSMLKLTRIIVASVALCALGSPVFAQGGDIYARLMEMHEMDKDHDGMISKQEFLDMIGKAWDMKVDEMKMHGDTMSPEHLKELEKTLGRVLSAQSAH